METVLEFKKELKSLFNKYNLKITENESYDGNDKYIGSEYYLVVDGETYYDETFIDIVRTY